MGGGGSQVSGYKYSAALAVGVCEGPVSNTGVVWKDKERTTLSALNLTMFPGESAPASPWGYLSTKHPGEAVYYPGLCYVCSPKFEFGNSADVPNLSFEVIGGGRLGAFKDAQPDYIVSDFVTNAAYGAAPGFPLGSLTGYGDYCRAMGLFISPAFTEQKEAAEYLKEIATCTNSEYVWSEGVLKLIPYADTAVSGNGYTYTPNLTPPYDLTDDDFCSVGEDPVKCSRVTPSDACNHIQVEFVNRNKDYNVEIAEAKDQADIEARGLRTKDPIKLHYICEPAIARTVAQLILQRELYVRNRYQFRLSSWKHCLLEPMDIVTITDPGMGLDKVAVRIKEIEEDEEDYLTITADEWPFGVGSVALYPHQEGQGYVPNYQVAPGNAYTPAIIEPPFRLTDNSLEIWLATSGGENWGGCDVWVSRDGASYSLAGTITSGSRHGTLVNPLPSGSAVDTVNTMRALLLDADLQLLAATQQEADELRTLLWVDGELIAYQNAALVSSGVYDLSYLVRGAHNSVIGTHSAGAKWARLDGSLFRVPFLPADIGKTIYIKLCSYNVYGVSPQTLDEVSAHTYTITGYAKQRLPVDITAPATPTVTTAANNTYPYTGHLILSWPAVSGISKYVVRYKKSTDTQWKETPVASGTTWKSPELLSGDTYDVAVASEDEQGYLSAWTVGAQTAIPYDVTAPATPGVITITPGIGFLGIQWPRNTDVDIAGYELQIAPDNSGSPGTWATVYTGPDNAHTYRGTPGATYWARARAFDRYPGTPKYSSYNGQTSAMVDFVKALDSANVPTGYNLQINSDFDTGTLDGWTLEGSYASGVIVTATNPKSGRYAIANAVAGQRTAYYSSRMIPIARDRVYVVEGYLKSESGSANGAYIGVQTLDATGAHVAHRLVAANNVTPPADFTYYSGVIGAGQAQTFAANEVYMRLRVVLNINQAATVQQAQGLRIREIIEAAYIKKASITDAEMLNVSASKIISGSVTSQTITLALTEGAGDVAIKAGKTDFGDNTAGFIIGMDDSDSNRVKLEVGDATSYIKFDPVNKVRVAGAITIQSGSSGFANLTDRPNTTYIDEYGVYTGEVVAEQITAGNFKGRNFVTDIRTTGVAVRSPGCAYFTSDYTGTVVPVDTVDGFAVNDWVNFQTTTNNVLIQLTGVSAVNKTLTIGSSISVKSGGTARVNGKTYTDNVVLTDASGLPTSGAILISDDYMVRSVSYTSKSGNTLTGCSFTVPFSTNALVSLGDGQNLIMSSISSEIIAIDGGKVVGSLGSRGTDGVLGKFGHSSYDKATPLLLANNSGALATALIQNYSTAATAKSLVLETRGGYGVSVENNAVGGGMVSPLYLWPSSSAAAPTHSARAGSFWLTSDCVVYINKSSPSPGTTWQKVGAQ